MAKTETANIRNLGIVGQGDVGKTSLTEAILFNTGMTDRLGRVDDGTSTMDFEPEEVKRQITPDRPTATDQMTVPHISSFFLSLESARYPQQTAVTAVTSTWTPVSMPMAAVLTPKVSRNCGTIEGMIAIAALSSDARMTNTTIV